MIVISYIVSRITQKFVGGALSSLAGMQSFYKAAEVAKGTSSLAKKTYKFKKKANYLINKSKPLTYGVQSLASDFAYTDREYYLKRNIGHHMRTFGFGFTNGAIQFEVGEIENRWQGYNITERLVGYGLDYLGQTINQGYNPFDYSKRYQKVGIFSLKSVIFNY